MWDRMWNQRSLTSPYNAISVAMAQWTVEHRMFAYDAYVQNGESVRAVQRLFRVYFNLGRRDTVPSRNTILRLIRSLGTTGSIVKKKPPGPNNTSQNIDSRLQAISVINTAPLHYNQTEREFVPMAETNYMLHSVLKSPSSSAHLQCV